MPGDSQENSAPIFPHSGALILLQQPPTDIRHHLPAHLRGTVTFFPRRAVPFCMVPLETRIVKQSQIFNISTQIHRIIHFGQCTFFTFFYTCHHFLRHGDGLLLFLLEGCLFLKLPGDEGYSTSAAVSSSRVASLNGLKFLNILRKKSIDIHTRRLDPSILNPNQ